MFRVKVFLFFQSGGCGAVWECVFGKNSEWRSIRAIISRKERRERKEKLFY